MLQRNRSVKDMNDAALVLVAFGTSTRARTTYAFIEKRVREKYPDTHIQWAFSSRMLREKMGGKKSGWKSLEEILLELEAQGIQKAAIQSLHVIPGVEFQKVVDAVTHSGLETSVGMPLLSSDADYQTVADALAGRIPDQREWATVLVGHGTYHTAGAAYLQFYRFLTARYPRNVFLSVVEGEPSWEDTLKLIRHSTVTKIKFIPLMFVAGEHIMHDVLGDETDGGEESWKMQLSGYEIDGSERGLGFNEKIVDIYLEHLVKAMHALGEKVSRLSG